MMLVITASASPGFWCLALSANLGFLAIPPPVASHPLLSCVVIWWEKVRFCPLPSAPHMRFKFIIAIKVLYAGFSQLCVVVVACTCPIPLLAQIGRYVGSKVLSWQHSSEQQLWPCWGVCGSSRLNLKELPGARLGQSWVLLSCLSHPLTVLGAQRSRRSTCFQQGVQMEKFYKQMCEGLWRGCNLCPAWDSMERLPCNFPILPSPLTLPHPVSASNVSLTKS